MTIISSLKLASVSLSLWTSSSSERMRPSVMTNKNAELRARWGAQDRPRSSSISSMRLVSSDIDGLSMIWSKSSAWRVVRPCSSDKNGDQRTGRGPLAFFDGDIVAELELVNGT
jgi:hypothetical protein